MLNYSDHKNNIIIVQAAVLGAEIKIQIYRPKGCTCDLSPSSEPPAVCNLVSAEIKRVIDEFKDFNFVRETKQK